MKTSEGIFLEIPDKNPGGSSGRIPVGIVAERIKGIAPRVSEGIALCIPEWLTIGVLPRVIYGGFFE